MTKRWPMAALSVALLLGSVQAQAAAPKAGAAPLPTNWRQIAIPPLPPFKPQEPKRVALPNGMIVFLSENHELPLISGSAMIRGGSDSEAAGKAGLVELYGQVWRTGGTEKLSGDALDDYLEARAAKVETGSSDESTSISFNSLKADFPEVLGVFVDLLRHPAFREEKLSLAKKELYSSISRRNDETHTIAAMQSEILGYGKESAYARVPEYATVAAVTREDLLQWHREHVTPNNIILGVTGDFDSTKMEATLRKAFADWPKGPPTEKPQVAIEPAKPGIYLVDKTDVNQSEVRMVGPGIERRNPDYFALRVMNEILGGGFASRLFVNLRTKAGLAYAVGGGVGSAWDHPGLTMLQIGTKTETTVEAIRGLWQQLDLMKQDPPTEAELKRAKDSILNSFIFNFDTPAKVMQERETYEFYGYPKDFLEQYRAAVEKVTAADVLRVAKKYLHREDLKVLVIGNASGFEKQLAALGTVTPVDISIPPPVAQPSASGIAPHAPQQVPAAMAENAGSSDAEGRAAMAKLAHAIGGEAKIASIKNLHQYLTFWQSGLPIHIEQITLYPDQQAQKIRLPQGDMLQVVTPTGAFMRLRGEVRALTPEQAQGMMSDVKRDFINVLQHLHDPLYTFSLLGTETMDDNSKATVVDVKADGVNARFWIGADGLLRKTEYSAIAGGRRETFTTQYSGWHSFDGLKYPTRFETTHMGAVNSRMVLNDMQVNSPVDRTLFDKPQP